MGEKDKKVDPLPEAFDSENEAAEFWDTHSITDYEEFLDPVEADAELKRRHFEIEIDEESFQALRTIARKHKKSVKSLASEILKEKLKAA